MDFLQQEHFGNTIEQWIIAVGLTVVAYVFLFSLLRFAVRRLGRLAAATETKLDDLLVAVLRSTRWYVEFAWSAYIGSQYLSRNEGVEEVFQTAVVLLSLLQVGLWGNHLISFWIDREVSRRMAQDAASATTMSGVRFISRLLLISIILMLALSNLGIDITALVAGLGVGGIAVALAAQNILGDLFASLSIVMDKPFQLGDFIVIGEFVGTVEHIGLKTTRVRSLSGEQIIFSNADLLSSRIRNYKRMAERRILFTIGVTYQTTEAQLRAIPGMLREILTNQKKARIDRAHFKSYGDSALIFEVVYYVTSSDYNEYMDIQQSVNLEIFTRFAKEGISFAYPTRTIFMTQEPPQAT